MVAQKKISFESSFVNFSKNCFGILWKGDLSTIGSHSWFWSKELSEEFLKETFFAPQSGPGYVSQSWHLRSRDGGGGKGAHLKREEAPARVHRGGHERDRLVVEKAAVGVGGSGRVDLRGETKMKNIRSWTEAMSQGRAGICERGGRGILDRSRGLQTDVSCPLSQDEIRFFLYSTGVGFPQI